MGTIHCSREGHSTRLLWLTAVALLIQSCATRPAPEQIHYYRHYGNKLENTPVSLIVDGCVLRDEIGSDYVLLDETEAVAQAARNAIQRTLEANRYEVVTSVVPLLCTLLATDDSDEPIHFEAVRSRGEERQELAFPIVRIEHSSEDEQLLVQAYRALLQQTDRALTSTDKNALARHGRETPLALDPVHIDLLRDALETDFVWIVRVGGVQVSAGKSIGTGILTITLVNLADNNLIWKKHSGTKKGNPANTRIYTVPWAQDVFRPFLYLAESPVVTAMREPVMSPEELLGTQDASALREEARVMHVHRVDDRDRLDAVARKIWAERISRDEIMVDAMAWFCRVLGQSRDARYARLLDRVAREAATRKLRRFAQAGRDNLAKDAAQPFEPWLIADAMPEPDPTQQP